MLRAAGTNTRSNTLQNSSSTAANFPPYKPFEKDEEDILGIAEKVRTNP